MYWAVLLLCLAVAGCGKDPLSEKVDQLEGRVTQLEAERAAQQQALLAQLDQVVVTADNTAEVADVRAKLAQTGLTLDDFNSLKARVEALEGKAVDWSTTVSGLERGVYAVMYGVVVDSTMTDLTFLGTAFAVDGQTLITNGHMVDGLLQLDQQAQRLSRRLRTTLKTAWIVVQNKSTVVRQNSSYFLIGTYAKHPGWNAQDENSVDVGLLRLKGGTMSRRLEVVSASDALRLKVGQPVATVGFPGELQSDQLSDQYPIATFKDGTISALRPPQPDQPYTAQDTYIVQHNLDLSGGTSGSPIFNPAGKVVAVNNAGISEVVLNTSGQATQVSQSALGFGIRADKIQELLALQPAAKPAVAGADAEWSSRLDGKDLSSLDIHAMGPDWETRLEERLTNPR